MRATGAESGYGFETEPQADAGDSREEDDDTPGRRRDNGEQIMAIALERVAKRHERTWLRGLQRSRMHLLTPEMRAEVERALAESEFAGEEEARALINGFCSKVQLWRAQNDYERYAALYEKQSITKQQYEQALAAKETAEKQLKVLEEQKKVAEKQAAQVSQQVNSTKSQTQISESQIDVANANIKKAEADLENWQEARRV